MVTDTLLRNSATRVTSLTTGWTLTRIAPGTVTTPEALSATATAWHPAIVPGTVAAAFPTSDPAAWTGIHDIDSADWWYRCTFATPERGTSPRHTLTLHGLATVADVWLNGTLVAHSDNMFITHHIDVTTLLYQDTTENELVIRFTSLHTTLATRRPRPRWKTKLVERQQLRWIRTTLLGRIAGWNESPQPVGPWRPVTIETHQSVQLDDITLCPRVDARDGILDATLHVTTPHAHTPHRITLHIGDTTTPLDVVCDTSTAGTTTTCIARGTARIPNVALWWPHTHGAQPRYHATVTLTFPTAPDVTLDLGHIAFRTITLDTTHGAFTLHVNDLPIFCRGACWTPPNITHLTASTAEYRDTLTLARDAGMNMLRVGGTMTYESDSFYEICDELGILIWQEFMFANMDYPDDAEFLDSVRTEVQQLLRRLQTRACLALLCGNNEVQQQAAMLGVARALWNAPLFAEHLPTLCAEYAPGIPYWSSSPSGGTFPFHPNAGDAHYFGHGPYLRVFDDVRLSGVRFASETLAFANVPEPVTVDHMEGGMAGAGHHPAWKRAVPRDNGVGWDFEDVRDHYVEQLFATKPSQLRRSNPERYLALGRVTTGEVIARTIGAWRRADSICHGALIWFFRDFQPGAGWGLIDATGRPKAAYYYFRRAARPTTVILSDEGLNGIRVDVANDSDTAVDATLRLTLYRQGEVAIADATTAITVAKHSTITLHGDALFDRFTDPVYAYRFGPPGHELVIATLTDRTTGTVLSDAVHWPIGIPSSHDRDLGITATATPYDDGTYTLTITTRLFAQSVAIDTAHFRPDDNYFHVPPMSQRTTVLRPALQGGILAGTVMPVNTSHSVRIIVG